jgi:hypothetical protein
MSKKKDEMILHELYRRAFAASTPYGNWDKMFEKAVINDRGEKVIPYMDYECDSNVLEDIFNTVMKEYKVPKRMQKSFSFSFYLGCSPKTKFYEQQLS